MACLPQTGAYPAENGRLPRDHNAAFAWPAGVLLHRNLAADFFVRVPANQHWILRVDPFRAKRGTLVLLR
jgi:hypothetical protein